MFGLLLLLATAAPQLKTVHGTWSIVAVDEATDQVGGAGATCRTAPKMPLNSVFEDFAWVSEEGAGVAQAESDNLRTD